MGRDFKNELIFRFNMVRVIQKEKKVIKLHKHCWINISIPKSNIFVGHISSLKENLWFDERNLLSVKMVKSELYVKLSYNMNCQEILHF